MSTKLKTIRWLDNALTGESTEDTQNRRARQGKEIIPEGEIQESEQIIPELKLFFFLN